MTRDTRKTVCFAVCVAIVVIAISALAWATTGFKNWNAESWFGYWGKGAPTVTEPGDPNTPVEPGKPSIDNFELLDKQNYDNLSVSAGSSQAMLLSTARAGSSDSPSFSLVATVADSEGNTGDYLQDVTWTMSWKNTDFSWDSSLANGTAPSPLTYVHMDTDGGVATFTLYNAFGTQIIVTCTSNINKSISATATIDYYKRLTSLNAKWGNIVGEKNIFTDEEEGYNWNPEWQEAQKLGNYPIMPGQVTFSRTSPSPGLTGIYFVSGWDYGVGSLDDPIITNTSYAEVSFAFNSGLSSTTTYKISYETLQNYIYTSQCVEYGIISGICGSNMSAFYSQGYVNKFNEHDKDLLVHFHFGTLSGRVYNIRYYVDIVVPQPNVSSVTIDKPAIYF